MRECVFIWQSSVTVGRVQERSRERGRKRERTRKRERESGRDIKMTEGLDALIVVVQTPVAVGQVYEWDNAQHTERERERERERKKRK